MKTKYLRYLLSVLVIVIAVYFFATRISASWEELTETTSLTPDIWAVLAVVFLASAVITSGVLWGKVLNYLCKEQVVSAGEAARVHIGAWLLKYVPGQVGSVVYKISWGTRKGIKRSMTAWSFVYENVLLTVVSMLPTSIILLLFGGLSVTINIVLGGILAASALLVLSRKYFKKFLGILAKKAKLANKLELLSVKTIAEFSVLYLIPRLLNGLGFVFIAHSLFSISIFDVIPLIAAYTLAGIIGIYAIFVPSGLGVREAMIVLFTSGILSVEEAALLALVTRFYATLTDGLLALMYTGLSTNKKGLNA